MSAIQKLPEIMQTDNETVVQCIGRCAEILLELKTKADVLDINMQLQINGIETAAYKQH